MIRLDVQGERCRPYRNQSPGSPVRLVRAARTGEMKILPSPVVGGDGLDRSIHAVVVGDHQERGSKR